MALYSSGVCGVRRYMGRPWCNGGTFDPSAELEKPEVYSDYIKVSALQEELDKITIEQDAYSEEWFTLSEELENL